MKINEIIVEAGFLNTLGNIGKGIAKGVGTVGKGVLKGAADVVAPGAWDELARTGRQSSAARSSTQKGVKPGNVGFQGNEYTWLGNQWGLVNPATGKAMPAPKAVQDQLNFLSTRKMPNFSTMSDDQLIDYLSLGKRAWPAQLKAEISKRPEIQQKLERMHTPAQPAAPVQPTQPPAAQTTPAGEAQSPADLVDRLYKLHPDWAPTVAQEILRRSQVTKAPK